jgi:hypothetical protein
LNGEFEVKNIGQVNAKTLWFCRSKNPKDHIKGKCTKTIN